MTGGEIADEALVGGCQCGAIRYRLSREPIYVNGCHCRDCQKLGGGAFAVNVMIEASAVEIIAGTPEPDGFAMVRCPACRTALWATHPMFGPAILFVRAGTLDVSERLEPDGHFFTRSKHPWIVLPPGVPAFETLPGPDEQILDEVSQSRVNAAVASGQVG